MLNRRLKLGSVLFFAILISVGCTSGSTTSSTLLNQSSSSTSSAGGSSGDTSGGTSGNTIGGTFGVTAPPTAPSNAVKISCNNNSGDATLVQAALTKGGAIVLVGTCNLGSAVLNMGSNTQLFGSVANGNVSGHGANTTTTLSYTGSGVYAMTSSGNDNTIVGLTFSGGGVNLTGTQTGGWTIMNNTFQNITHYSAGNSEAAVYISGMITADSSGKANSISNNQFTNLWQGGYPANMTLDYESIGGSGIWWFNGIAQTVIDNNFFNEIGYNAIKGFNDGMYNATWEGKATGVVVSNNNMALVHRIGIEVQGCGRGGCVGSFTPINGVIVSGNYVHDFPAHADPWSYSMLFGGSNSQYINNTGTFNSVPADGCSDNYFAIEDGMRGGVTNGNVFSSITNGCNTGYNYISDSYGSGTNYFQNNLLCGPDQPQALNKNATSATDIFEYNFQASTCPSSNLTASNITIGFTSTNNQSTNGGSATWNLYVTNILSIKQVNFFVDNSTTPVVSQRAQDVSTTFATDRKWLYHATFSTANLSSGAHTITAVATDVADATQSASQNFTR